MVFISKYLVPKGYTGITLFPFVILKSKDLRSNKVFMNHENIHLRQQLEMLIIPFYLFYVIEFLFRLIQYRNWHLAYKNIPFEREAYYNQHNFQYLKQRSFWIFLKYLHNHGV